MGQIKNIKLHIVTDIKCLVYLKIIKAKHGRTKIEKSTTQSNDMGQIDCTRQAYNGCQEGFLSSFYHRHDYRTAEYGSSCTGHLHWHLHGNRLKKKVIAWNEATE